MFVFLREVVPSRGASLGLSVIFLCKAEAFIPPSLHLCLAHHAVCEWTVIAYRHGSRCHGDEGHPGCSHTWQAPPMAICNPQSCILIHLELAFPWCQRIFIFKFPTHILPWTHYFNETRLWVNPTWELDNQSVSISLLFSIVSSALLPEWLRVHGRQTQTRSIITRFCDFKWHMKPF